jgi:divalent metal cation (Fe/Co/Zn/Cd) transporter
MDNTRKFSTSNIIFPVLIAAILIAGYFVYQGFFTSASGELDSISDKYLKETKIGQYMDIINKENISFNTNINNSILTNGSDFSKIISPSQSLGRSNPFLP